MNNFIIHTLGCGSARPSLRHSPSSTVVEHRGSLYMIDCGEGAQQAFMRQKLSFSKLRHIFLTHLHGDHVFGIPGLIGTLALSGNGGEITIHTFEEGKIQLKQILDYFCHDTPFDIKFNVIKSEEAVILDSRSLTVRTIPLNHRIPAVGFIFEEKPKERHINPEMIAYHQVPISMIKKIKAGEDFIKTDGTIINNELLTTPADHAYSYAHISDTAYMPEISSKIGPVDLLFHETTYLEGLKDEALKRGHSTARQAAMIAKASGAKCLLTGQYSSRYKDETPFLEEASEIFPNVILNREGLRIKLY